MNGSVIGLAITCGVLTAALVGVVTYMVLSENEDTNLAPEPCPCAQNKPPKRKAYVELTRDEILLPTNLKPIQYWLTIKSLLKLEGTTESERVFWGNVTISFECKESTDKIVLNSDNITNLVKENVLVESTSAVGPKVIPVTKLDFNQTAHKMFISLGSALKRGTVYTVAITDFSGYNADDGIGFYLSTYKFQGTTRYLGATQFEVVGARRVFPCFDEPRYKANFTITILRRPEFRSLSNMKLNREDKFVEGHKGFRADHYKTTVIMSTYLVAFAVCDFNHINTTVGSTKSGSTILIRGFAPPPKENTAQFAVDMAKLMLPYFENFFGIAYPLEKLDLLALPDFTHGAMENWGLVTYRQTAMLFDENKDEEKAKEFIAMVTAHEIAHQWFGNLVTMEWWTDLWLNEALANYLGYVIPEKVDKNQKMHDEFLSENIFRSMQTDALVNTHPIVSEVYDPVAIMNIFDTIVYKKGASMLFMLDKLLKRDNLRDGLRVYLKENAYKNAVSEVLYKNFDAIVRDRNMESHFGHMSISEILSKWITNAGFPLITVHRSPSGRMTITQKRYYLARDESTIDEHERTFWPVPFTYLLQPELPSNQLNYDEPQIKWSTGENEVEIDPNVAQNKWILGNIDHQGYFRTNYDTTTWHLLSQQLKNDPKKIHKVSRATIIDDAFALARSGELPIGMAMNMTTYLNKEHEYIVWDAVMGKNALSFIDRVLLPEDSYCLFMKYMKNILDVEYRRHSWNSTVRDKYQIELRKKIFTAACYYEIPSCIQRAKTEFREFMKTGSPENIQKDLLSVVTCTAIKSLETDAWEFLWNQYVKADSPQAKIIYLESLACTRNDNLLMRLLRETLKPNSEIKTFDIFHMFGGLRDNPAGRKTAWHFFRNHYDLFKEKLSVNVKRLDVAWYFTTVGMLNEFDEFVSTMQEDSRRFRQVREEMKFAVDWKHQHLNELVHWLAHEGNHDRIDADDRFCSASVFYSFSDQ